MKKMTSPKNVIIYVYRHICNFVPNFLTVSIHFAEFQDLLEISSVLWHLLAILVFSVQFLSFHYSFFICSLYIVYIFFICSAYIYIYVSLYIVSSYM